MAAALTEDARKKANLRLIQRSIDSNIEDIVGSATHVVLYEYIAPQGWEKLQVEGSLFLVAQQGHEYALAILNRHSTDNFQVPVTKAFQLQHKEPYLIFKQSPKILGIWFHNSNERVVMASLLNQVIQNLQHHSNRIAVPTPPRPTIPPQQQQQQQQQPQQQQQQSIQYIQQQQHLPPQQAAVATTSVPLQPNDHAGRPDAACPLAQQQMHIQMGTTTATTTTSSPSPSVRSNNAYATSSPSQLIEPLLNSLFVSPSDSSGTGGIPPRPPPTLSLSSTTTTPASNHGGADDEDATSSSTGATPPRPSIPGVALDKKSLQLALLSLIQDERFIDLLHAQYLKVAHARASRNNKK